MFVGELFLMEDEAGEEQANEPEVVEEVKQPTAAASKAKDVRKSAIYLELCLVIFLLRNRKRRLFLFPHSL